MARQVPHEPTDDCWSDHCHIHGVDEPGYGYLVCRECSHLFRTRWHLWYRFVRKLGPILWTSPRRGDAPTQMPYEMAFYADGTPPGSAFGPLLTWRGWAWTLVRLPLIRPSNITYCPECAHDF